MSQGGKRSELGGHTDRTGPGILFEVSPNKGTLIAFACAILVVSSTPFAITGVAATADRSLENEVQPSPYFRGDLAQETTIESGTGVTVQVDETPNVSHKEGGTALPGEQLTIDYRVENTDIAFLGIPKSWEIEGRYSQPQMRDCGSIMNGYAGVRNGNCEMIFTVPITANATARVIAELIVDKATGFISPLLKEVLEEVGVFDGLERAIQASIAPIISDIFESTNTRELKMVVWISTPGGETDRKDSASLSIPVRVSQDETRELVRVPILAGDFEPASQSPSDVKYAEVYTSTSPTASFTYSPETPGANKQITFDASNSKDPDGALTTYEWDFDEDGQADATGETVTHNYATDGVYNVTLTVTDNSGAQASTSEMVSVQEQSGDKQVELQAQAPSAVGKSETFTLEYTVTNTGDQEMTVGMRLTDVPSELSVTDYASPTGRTAAQNAIFWTEPIQPGEEYKATYTIRTDSDAPVGEYDIVASAESPDGVSSDATETVVVRDDGPLKLRAEAPSAVGKSETFTLEYTVTNTGDQEMTVGMRLTDVPSELSVTDYASPTGRTAAQNAIFWTEPIQPGEEYKATYTIRTDSDAPVGEYDIVASAESPGKVSATTITAISVQESGDLSRFDTNGMEGIQFDELMIGISAYNNQETIGGEPVNFRDLMDLINAYNTG